MNVPKTTPDFKVSVLFGFIPHDRIRSSRTCDNFLITEMSSKKCPNNTDLTKTKDKKIANQTIGFGQFVWNKNLFVYQKGEY